MTNVTNLIKEVELYLEGVKIPTFNSIDISESENTLPSAQIIFAATPSILRILPGTIVQIFISFDTKMYTNTFEEKSILIFEGKITRMSYNKSSSGSIVTFNAMSLLAEMHSATLRPNTALITTARNDAELNHKVHIRIDNTLKTSDDKPLFTRNAMINSSSKSTENSEKSSDIYDGTLDQIKELATFGDIANTLAKHLTTKNTQAYKGNFIEFIRELNRYFIQSDVYYGINSVSYKLGQSVVVLPNKATGFDLKVTWQAMNNMFNEMNQSPTGSDNIYLLMNLIQQFLQFMGYKFIIPACPISARYFHVAHDDLNIERPIRMVLMPDFESGPPILSNIFFPEQVSSINFSHDFLSEPTRVIGQLNYSFLDSAIPGNMMPITVVPDVQLHYSKAKRTAVSSKYTDEESYKGVVLKVVNHDGAIVRALQENKRVQSLADKTPTQPLNSNDKKDIHPSLRNFVLNDYLNLKYGQRAVQITAEWSPYRIVGLPAMIFEPGKPTIVGILAAMGTSIKADGQAMASYTLRNCRIIFDESKDVFSKDPSTSEDKDKDKDKLDSFVVSDFVSGGVLGANPLMYKPEYYSMENIGSEVYPLFTIESLLKKSEIGKFLLDQELYNNDAYIDDNGGNKINYSIIRYIDSKDLDEFKTNNKDLELELYNTKLLYLAISSFKKAHTHNDIAAINSLTSRHLVTKDNYLTSIDTQLFLDDNTFEGWKKNSKDLRCILQEGFSRDELISTLVTMDDLLSKEDIATILNPNPKSSIESDYQFLNNVDVQDKYNIFRPYNTTRRAHIQQIIKEYTSLNKKNEILVGN